MIRAIALSLAMLLGIAVVIPIATDNVEAAKKKKHRHKRKKVKKYSKRWWRQYRARVKRQKAAAARRRALRLRQIRLAKIRQENPEKAVAVTKKTKLGDVRKPEEAPAVLPTGDQAPKGWKKAEQTQAEIQFNVENENGSPIGKAAISVVGPAAAGDDNPKAKTVGGVPTASLRRNVIDRMVRENGWVVNDFQKEIGGQKVYVVIAQAEVGGRIQSRMFYFTESEGRIYSVATAAPGDATDRIAEESEKVVSSFIRNRRGTTQSAELNK